MDEQFFRIAKEFPSLSGATILQHASNETTTHFYITQDDQQTADGVWEMIGTQGYHTLFENVAPAREKNKGREDAGILSASAGVNGKLPLGRDLARFPGGPGGLLTHLAAGLPGRQPCAN